MNNIDNIPLNQKCWYGNSLPCEICKYNLKNNNITKIKYTDIINNENVLITINI